MKRAAVIITAVILMLVTLSSCSGTKLFMAADSLLAPPLFYDEYEGLVELFRSQSGANVSLCAPYEGEYRSAIIVEDFDDDNDDEAMIFYREAANDPVAKARFYESSDGEWTQAGDFAGHGNQVENVTVRDMNGDGVSEIIVFWSVSGVSVGKSLSVYHTPGNNVKFKEISNEACSVSMIEDIDGDSLDDIFLITQTSNAAVAPQRSARLFGFSGSTAVLKGDVRVDANISNYVAVKTEKSESGSYRIYVDALKGEGQMITELIVWDSARRKLVAPLFDEATMSTMLTHRNEPIMSADINGDGVLDVPSQAEIFSSSENEMTIDPNHLYITSWMNFFDDGNETVVNSLVNYDNGYMLTLDSRERFALSVEDVAEENRWVVKEKIAETAEEKELYSITRVSADKAEQAASEGYTAVIEKEEYTVFVYITPYGIERGITAETLKEKILPLQQAG